MLQRWCSGECASASTNRCSSSLTSSTSRPSPLHHTRSRRLVAVRSSSSDDVPPEKQAILDRINKAKAYKQGAAAPARSPPPGAPPPPTPKQPDWGAMTAYLGGSPSAADAGTQQGSTPPTLPIDAQQQQQLTEEQRRAEAERQRRILILDQLQLHHMRQSIMLPLGNLHRMAGFRIPNSYLIRALKMQHALGLAQVCRGQQSGEQRILTTR
eukprot:1154888-Pelagomonas_calceolata.AAC.3